MLEQLRDQQLETAFEGDGAGDMVNAVATADADGTVALVVWNGTVDVAKSNGDPLLDRDVELSVNGLAAPAYRLRHRRLDAQHSNINAAWCRISSGRPWPDDDAWPALAEADHLDDYAPITGVRPDAGAVSARFALPMPAVSLIELTPAGG
jgi:xylan 1,4-beta-xylosidase